MKKQKNVSLKVYPNRIKQNKTTGNCPVYLKLTYNGQKVETRLDASLDLTSTELPLWDEMLMRVRTKDSTLNNYIHVVEQRFAAYNIENNYQLRHPLKHLLDTILGREEILVNKITTHSFCKSYIEKNVNLSNEITKGTKTNYNKAFKHFSNFLSSHKLMDCSIGDFKYNHAVDFKLYMGSPEVHNCPVSTSSNIRRIKTMFYEAINLDLIVKNPFDKIKMVYRSKEKTPCLTINQVKQIIECDAIANNPDLLYYRDLFLFGCFTGLSCISIINLASNVLFPIFNNRIKLDTLRDKTGKLIVQIIPAPAQGIMEKYSNLRQHGQVKVFPTFCNETFNIKLKEIAAHAGLNINLTTKISRTTCNQIVVNTGQFDLIYKRAYMGWSNSNDIQDVYTTLVDDVLLQNTLRLEAFLMNNIGNDLLIKL